MRHQKHWRKDVRQDLIVMDFSKVFGKVSYSLLVHKLHCYSIAGKVSAWIESFLGPCLQESVCCCQWYQICACSCRLWCTPRLCSWSKPVTVVHQQFADRTVINIQTLFFASNTICCKEMTCTQDQRHLQQDLDKLAE